MVNRRGFLGAIAAGLVADPERLLWVPKRYVQGVDLVQTVAAERLYGKYREEWQHRPGGWKVNVYYEGVYQFSNYRAELPFSFIERAPDFGFAVEYGRGR